MKPTRQAARRWPLLVALALCTSWCLTAALFGPASVRLRNALNSHYHRFEVSEQRIARVSEREARVCVTGEWVCVVTGARTPGSAVYALGRTNPWPGTEPVSIWRYRGDECPADVSQAGLVREAPALPTTTDVSVTGHAVSPERLIAAWVHDLTSPRELYYAVGRRMLGGLDTDFRAPCP